MSIRNSKKGEKDKNLLIRDTINSLKKHNISKQDILKYLNTKEETIPVSILNKNLSPLQAIVKHLVENKTLSFSKIADLLKRDQRTIWNTYRKANLKQKERITEEPSKYHIDLSILANRKLSVLENICTYLKEHYNLTYRKIAILLAKDDRTIWTVCKRAEKKHEA